MKAIMTYNMALTIVNQYGMENNCDSLIEAICMMEDNRDVLSRFQSMCMEIVIGEMEEYYGA